MGIGKAISSPRVLIVSVFATMRSNWKLEMKVSKCSSPTHGLQKKPSTGL